MSQSTLYYHVLCPRQSLHFSLTLLGCLPALAALSASTFLPAAYAVLSSVMSWFSMSSRCVLASAADCSSSPPPAASDTDLWSARADLMDSDASESAELTASLMVPQAHWGSQIGSFSNMMEGGSAFVVVVGGEHFWLNKPKVNQKY